MTMQVSEIRELQRLAIMIIYPPIQSWADDGLKRTLGCCQVLHVPCSNCHSLGCSWLNVTSVTNFMQSTYSR